MASHHASSVSQAHPRECGDDAWLLRRAREFAGSPPRMRGRRGHLADHVMGSGLTPANAGTTMGDQSF